jgi:hypothetical protein
MKPKSCHSLCWQTRYQSADLAGSHCAANEESWTRWVLSAALLLQIHFSNCDGAPGLVTKMTVADSCHELIFFRDWTRSDAGGEGEENAPAEAELKTRWRHILKTKQRRSVIESGLNKHNWMKETRIWIVHVRSRLLLQGSGAWICCTECLHRYHENLRWKEKFAYLICSLFRCKR